MLIPLEFKYILTKEEIEEALLDLDYKREGKSKTVNLWMITGIGIVVLIACVRHPEQFFLFLLLVLIILLLLYMTYGIRLGRKKRAEQIAGIKGEYMLEITDSCMIHGTKKEKIQLSNSKIEVFRSAHVFVIRAGKDVFTIPLRILSKEQESEILRIMRKCGASFVKIVIGKE